MVGDKHLNFLEIFTQSSISESRNVLKHSGENRRLIPICFAAWGVRCKRELSCRQCYVVQKRESFAACGRRYVSVLANVPESTDNVCMKNCVEKSCSTLA